MRSRSVNNPKAEIPAEVNGVTVGTPIKAEPNSIPAADIPETKINNPTIDTDNALKLQIEALRNSEQISRERMEQQRQAQLMRQARLQDMRPASREEKIAIWKQNGLTAANEAFLLEHPQMIDHDQLTAYATQEALASGLKHDSDDFRRAVKTNFDTAMRHLQAEAEHHEPTPQFFVPPEAKPAPEPATRSAALASAPVSREIPNADRSVSVPSRVNLSPEQKQIADASGISYVEYARNLLRMQEMQRKGLLQT